jgi:hypothetical protein
MVKAAGRPDQIAYAGGKDRSGKRLPYDRWLWRDGHGTVIVVNRETGKAIFAVCDLRSISQTPNNYPSD